jgi:hypothetical protein
MPLPSVKPVYVNRAQIDARLQIAVHPNVRFAFWAKNGVQLDLPAVVRQARRPLVAGAVTAICT